jgi:segregation and condensation protein B
LTIAPDYAGETGEALPENAMSDNEIPESNDSENAAPDTESAPTETEFHADLKQQIEVLIFTSDEVISAKAIQQALGERKVKVAEVEAAIDELNQVYEQTGRTFRIRHIAEGYRFLTEKQFSRTVQTALQPKLTRRLSQAALETLAIISYKQPISRTEIESIRGTNIDYVIRALMEKNLIYVSGRSESVGKPLLYGTTKEFLDYFNLRSLADLPKPREIDELMREGDAQELLKQELNSRLKVELETDDLEKDAAETDRQTPNAG